MNISRKLDSKTLKRHSKDLSKLTNFKQIEQYYIKAQVLGQGSFAKTFLATYVADQTQILACKMIEKQTIKTKLQNQQDKVLLVVKQIQDEIEIWKKLNNPHIIKYFGMKETPNNMYLFLEFCDDKTLENKIKNGPIPQQQCLEYIHQIIEGCCYLYDNSIFHRDLKPDNILLHNNKIKICDFGFAQIMDQDKKDVAQSNQALGSPYYMAPQVLDRQAYSIKCDVWSLGVICYRLLYNKMPWENITSIEDLKFKIHTQPIEYPNTIHPQLQNLIRRMLVIQENYRYSIKQCKEIVDTVSLVNQIPQELNNRQQSSDIPSTATRNNNENSNNESTMNVSDNQQQQTQQQLLSNKLGNSINNNTNNITDSNISVELIKKTIKNEEPNQSIISYSTSNKGSNPQYIQNKYNNAKIEEQDPRIQSYELVNPQQQQQNTNGSNGIPIPNNELNNLIRANGEQQIDPCASINSEYLIKNNQMDNLRKLLINREIMDQPGQQQQVTNSQNGNNINKDQQLQQQLQQQQNYQLLYQSPLVPLNNQDLIVNQKVLPPEQPQQTQQQNVNNSDLFATSSIMYWNDNNKDKIAYKYQVQQNPQPTQKMNPQQQQLQNQSLQLSQNIYGSSLNAQNPVYYDPNMQQHLQFSSQFYQQQPPNNITKSEYCEQAHLSMTVNQSLYSNQKTLKQGSQKSPLQDLGPYKQQKKEEDSVDNNNHQLQQMGQLKNSLDMGITNSQINSIIGKIDLPKQNIIQQQLQPQQPEGNNKRSKKGQSQWQQSRHKNIWTNFGKALNKIFKAHPEFKQIKLNRMKEFYPSKQQWEIDIILEEFSYYVEHDLKLNRKIDFKEGWTFYEDDNEKTYNFKKILRELSEMFFRDYALQYLLNSRMKEFDVHIKAIPCMQSALKNPRLLIPEGGIFRGI